MSYLTNPLSETSQSSSAWVDTNQLRGKKRTTGHQWNKRPIDDGDDDNEDNPNNHRSEKLQRVIDRIGGSRTTGVGPGTGTGTGLGVGGMVFEQSERDGSLSKSLGKHDPPGGVSTAASSSSSKISIVPVTLPAHIHFVGDFTIAEAPLLSFDISLLSPLIGR